MSAVLAVTHDRYFLDHVAESPRSTVVTSTRTKATRPTSKRSVSASPSRQERREARQAAFRRTTPGSQQREVRQAKSKARSRATKRWRPKPSAPESSTSKRSRFRRAHASARSCSTRRTSKRGSTQLIDGLTFALPRNGIVGVIGPNGVGKTTLFKTISWGSSLLDGGDLKVGETVQISGRRPEPWRG